MPDLRRKSEGREKEEKKKVGHGSGIDEDTSSTYKTLLLHTCCAPCLTYTYREFGSRFDEITALWFNPNIHPFKEYESRFSALKIYEEKTGHDVIYLDIYDLEGFLEGISEVESRCNFCIEWRFRKTAVEGVKRGFDSFSSTLILSPYQDHDRLKKLGKKVAKEEGIEFIYEDMRDGFEEHHRLADEMNLYKQGYCGCIFSEKERYHKDLE